MTHTSGRTSLALLLGLAVAAGACGKLAYKSRIDEFRNASMTADRFKTIAILPADPNGPDPNIAARVRGQLRREGISIVNARVMVGEGEVGMKELCSPQQPAEYQGVLFVTWDKIILRDCETSAVAYRASGSYSGVDLLAKKLLLYLKNAPTE